MKLFYWVCANEGSRIKLGQLFIYLKRENIKSASMNYANSLKSPRGSLAGSSINNQLGEVVTLQQQILERDKMISDLQGHINRLELKNKEYSSYQQAMIEYEAKAEEAEA